MIEVVSQQPILRGLSQYCSGWYFKGNLKLKAVRFMKYDKKVKVISEIHCDLNMLARGHSFITNKIKGNFNL